MNVNTQSQFETWARQAEALAIAQPGRYKFGIVLYTLLGYAFILSILALLFGLTGLIVGSAFLSTALFIILLKKKLIFVLIPAIWILLKAMWVRFEPITGYKLNLRDYPVLDREIRELRAKLKALKVHQVILTPEFNAAMAQTPRLGIFGWHKNTLILGLELLLTLSPEQARAVLAHEFGHLSGNHSRFKGWIYRVRSTWDRVAQAYAGMDSMGARLMFKFFNWYAPRFSAYTFALARMNEYEADAVAAQITSPQIVTEALVNTYVTSGYADKDYWAQYFKKADRMPQPDHAPWAGLAQFINEHRLSGESYVERLEEQLTRATNYYDTHPALKDRVAALKVSPQPPAAVQQTAAVLWLGARLPQVIADFDNEWLNAQNENWRKRYDYVVDSRQKLAALAPREVQDLSDDELWTKATLSEEFIDEEVAMPLYRAMQARHPQNSNIAFAIGRLLINRKDDAGLEQMKAALMSPQLALEACQYAYRFLESNNRMEEARWWQQQYDEQNQIIAESQQERAQLNPGEPLEKAGLPAATIIAIADALKGAKNVKRVWLARKKLEHYPQFPALAFVVQIKGFVMNADKRAMEIVQALSLEHNFFAVARGGDFKKLAKQIIKAGDQIV
jgi:Zn-dependent protease with chaperone function